MLYFPPLPVWLDAFLQIDGGCSSGVEPRFVVPVVAGSSPVGHPISVVIYRYRIFSWKSINYSLVLGITFAIETYYLRL